MIFLYQIYLISYKIYIMTIYYDPTACGPHVVIIMLRHTYTYKGRSGPEKRLRVYVTFYDDQYCQDYNITRSLGARWAPTSSCRPFGPA